MKVEPVVNSIPKSAPVQNTYSVLISTVSGNYIPGNVEDQVNRVTGKWLGKVTEVNGVEARVVWVNRGEARVVVVSRGEVRVAEANMGEAKLVVVSRGELRVINSGVIKGGVSIFRN